MNNNRVLEIIDTITNTIGLGIQIAIANIGVSFLPILSGFMFSILLYTILIDTTGSVIVSLIASFISGIGLESTGFRSAKLMIRKPHILTIGLFLFYIFIGGFGAWFINDENQIEIILSMAFLLTAESYIIYGIEKREETLQEVTQDNADNEKQEVIDTEQRDYERKQAEKQTRFENKLRVEKMRGLGNVTKKNGTKVYDKTVTTNNNNTPQTNGNSTNRVPFKSLTTHDKTEMAQMTINDIVTNYNISKRTAHRWVKQIQE